MPLKEHYLSEPLRFGKYEGESLASVINKDVDYITWCLENINDFALATTSKTFYNMKLKDKTQELIVKDFNLVGKLDDIAEESLPSKETKKIKDESQFTMDFGEDP